MSSTLKMQIIYESSQMLILNKPRRVHSDEALAHCGISGRTQWKPVHRIDYETSGCLMFCSPEAEDSYASLFRAPTDENPSSAKARKFYIAGCEGKSNLGVQAQLVHGFVVSRYRRSQKVQFLTPWSPDINKKWHSKRAASHWVHKLEALPQGAPSLEGEIHQIELVTGARHQIRAYFASLGAPLVGDPIYNPNQVEESKSGLSLHAWKLEFVDPLNQSNVSAVASQIFE